MTDHKCQEHILTEQRYNSRHLNPSRFSSRYCGKPATYNDARESGDHWLCEEHARPVIAIRQRKWRDLFLKCMCKAATDDAFGNRLENMVPDSLKIPEIDSDGLPIITLEFAHRAAHGVEGGNNMTLGEEYPLEQARLRALLKQYQEIGPAGRFGALMIETSLAEADKAAMSGDPVAMLRAFQDMKGFAS